MPEDTGTTAETRDRSAENHADAEARTDESDTRFDVNVEDRTAEGEGDDPLNVGDQEGPRGARLTPGAGHDPDRSDEAREFNTAADVDPNGTVQPDGTLVLSELVVTRDTDASGRKVRRVVNHVDE